MACDLTCILIGHREGRISVPSLRSFAIAIEHARAAGLVVQPLYYLDNPDEITLALFDRYKVADGVIEQVSYADQGLVRNEAAATAKGRYTAFLDADDLWSREWLVQGCDYLKNRPDKTIAHPAYNYFFERQATIFCHVDQESPEFRPDLLRVMNYWDALCVAPTEAYRQIPFAKRQIDKGWAFEDWAWNCDTVAAGYIHKVVPDTVLFKRRQASSQTLKASANLSQIRRHALSSYAVPFYRDSG